MPVCAVCASALLSVQLSRLCIAAPAPAPLKTRPGPPVLLSSSPVSTGAPTVLTLTGPGLRGPGGVITASWTDGDTGTH